MPGYRFSLTLDNIYINSWNKQTEFNLSNLQVIQSYSGNYVLNDGLKIQKMFRKLWLGDENTWVLSTQFSYIISWTTVMDQQLKILIKGNVAGKMTQSHIFRFIKSKLQNLDLKNI